MIGVAFTINNLQDSVTGASVAPVCECSENIDCDDSDPATEDICLYADDCEAATCVYN